MYIVTFCYDFSRRTAYQSTSLPFVPGIVTRTMSIPPLGDLHHLYPETFGGVSITIFISSMIIICMYIQYLLKKMPIVHLCSPYQL